jgi:hypothetical protein
MDKPCEYFKISNRKGHNGPYSLITIINTTLIDNESGPIIERDFLSYLSNLNIKVNIKLNPQKDHSKYYTVIDFSSISDVDRYGIGAVDRISEWHRKIFDTPIKIINCQDMVRNRFKSSGSSITSQIIDNDLNRL